MHLNLTMLIRESGPQVRFTVVKLRFTLIEPSVLMATC